MAPSAAAGTFLDGFRGQVVTNGHGVFQLSALFVVGFVCVHLRTFVSMTTLLSLPDAVDRGLLLAGVAFLALHVASRAWEYGSRLAPLALVVASTAYTYLASGETVPLCAALVVVAAATAGDPRSLVRLWLSMTLFLTLFLVAAYTLVATFDPASLTYILRAESGSGSVVRLTFFFVHPNMAAATAMMMCGAHLYLNYDRLGFRSYALVLGVAALVFALTDSRTSTALIVLLVACFAAQRRWGVFDRRAVRRLVAAAPVALFVAAYLVAGPLYTDALGQMLTTRVSLWHHCLMGQGVTLLGQPFAATQLVGADGWVYYYTTLDSAYAEGLLVFGVCFSAFFCWCVWSRVMGDDLRASAEIPLIVAMLIFGITEVHMFSPVIGMPLLLLTGGILPSQNVGGASGAGRFVGGER